MSVLLVTSLGDVVIDLFTDDCPLTCKNFLKLAMINYYNGCLFHNVQQARFFEDEIHSHLKHSKKGTVAMASAGKNLNASQFYITLRDDIRYLDGKHTVFGNVAEGLDVLVKINQAYVDDRRIRFDFSQSAYKEWHKYRFKMTRSRSLRPKKNPRSFVHKPTMGGRRVSSHG
uniref:PPIase cyclophilin-type domain-containing protein n=1 Tax=Chenopodium quinoa TaxID=63459 RepID=A0A803ME16_CHEQI